MKTITTALFIFSFFFSQAQNQTIFLKHDTVTLKSALCNWLIPQQSITTGKQAKNNTVGKWYLDAISQGKLKAVDPESGAVIPPNKISTWTSTPDTMAVANNSGDVTKYEVVVAVVNPEDLSIIKIEQDWYMDVSTGKLSQQTMWIQLMKEVHTPSGMFLGYIPFCRINY